MLAVAAAACAAAVALVAAGTFGDGATQHGPTSFEQTIGDEMLVHKIWSGGALMSIAITQNFDVANPNVEVRVLHSGASTLRAAEAVSETDVQRDRVVFQEQVATTTAPAGSWGMSSWSGTLSPSRWAGGCRRGFYDILIVAVPPGTSLGDVPYQDTHRSYSGWFGCGGG